MTKISIEERWSPKNGNLEFVCRKKKGFINTGELRDALLPWLKSHGHDDERWSLFVRFFLTEDEDIGFNDDEGDAVIVTMYGSDEKCPVCLQPLKLCPVERWICFIMILRRRTLVSFARNSKKRDEMSGRHRSDEPFCP